MCSEQLLTIAILIAAGLDVPQERERVVVQPRGPQEQLTVLVHQRLHQIRPGFDAAFPQDPLKPLGLGQLADPERRPDLAESLTPGLHREPGQERELGAVGHEITAQKGVIDVNEACFPLGHTISVIWRAKHQACGSGRCGHGGRPASPPSSTITRPPRRSLGC